MSTSGFDQTGIDRLRRVLDGHVSSGAIPGLAWLASRHGEVVRGVAGTIDAEGRVPIAQDAIFRISSMTKPVAAVAALVLVEDCGLRLDDPVDRWLPELADPQVVRDAAGPLDDTVPANRPITVRDVLTFRLGWGYDFSSAGPQTVIDAMGDLGLGAGPPQPADLPDPDEWIRRLGTLPLQCQPGERWLYNTGADVLGVLVGRAAGQPFEVFLRKRILEPLGMRDTGFSTPSDQLHRLGPCFGADETGARTVFDPSDGQWSTPPRFPAGGSGLVSTVSDYLAFAEMLAHGGQAPGGPRILSRATIEAMTTDQLTAEQRRAGPDPSGAQGWGFGVSVQVERTGPAPSIGTYGWSGGLGSTWANDPTEGVIGILLTNQTWTSPVPPAAFADFWTCVYTSLAG